MAEAITSLGLTRLHLVGHSLGGAVALALAATRLHDNIASLALIAPVGLGQQVNRNFVTGFIEARKRRELQKVLELLFANPALVTPDMADDVLRFKRLDGAEDALRKIAEANFSEDGLADLLSLSRDLHSPATVIWGLADKVVPAPLDDRIRATYERLPGVGHMPHMEAAAVVNRLLASHFAGNE